MAPLMLEDDFERIYDPELFFFLRYTAKEIKASFHLSLASFFTLNGLIRSLLAQAASVQGSGS